MKVISFANDKGLIVHLPLSFVADHRAKYYEENDLETTYQAEFDFVMGDDYEGIDWLRNNMNFEDYESALVVVRNEESSLEEKLGANDVEIVIGESK